METDFNFYVYAYLRSKDSKTAKAGTPYYIGKGKGKRAFSVQHSVPIPKNKELIVFLEKNLSDCGALALERRYIRWYGRKIEDKGILLNKTEGGDGVGYDIASQWIKLSKDRGTFKAGKIQGGITRSTTGTAKTGGLQAHITRTARGIPYVTPESIAKMVKTRKEKGSYKNTPEAIALMLKTSKERGVHSVTSNRMLNLSTRPEVIEIKELISLVKEQTKIEEGWNKSNKLEKIYNKSELLKNSFNIPNVPKITTVTEYTKFRDSILRENLPPKSWHLSKTEVLLPYLEKLRYVTEVLLL